MNLLGFDAKEFGVREIRERIEQKRREEVRSAKMAVVVMLIGIGFLGLVTWLLIG